MSEKKGSTAGHHNEKDETSRPRIIVIVGPTASGKSSLAIHIAKKFNGRVISADSRQVYRGMDIGTGKVTKREQKRIRHYLLDIANPRQHYSAHQFQRDAQHAIKKIVRAGAVPIICGGTHFWVESLMSQAQFPPVAPDRKLRARLSRLSAAQLYARLRKLDARRAATIDRHNPVRLIRALEIIAKTGRAVSLLVTRRPNYEYIILGIAVPSKMLDARIEKRLAARLRAGLIAEVKRLRRNGVSAKRLDAFGLEYRYVARYLAEEFSRAELEKKLASEIKKYARKQRTWLRALDRSHTIHWISSEQRADALIKKFLQKERGGDRP